MLLDQNQVDIKTRNQWNDTNNVPIRACVTKIKQAGVLQNTNVIACSLKPQEEFSLAIIMSHMRETRGTRE